MRLARPCLGIGLAALLIASCGGGTHQLVGYSLEPVPEVGDLALPDAATGQPYSLMAEPGGLLLVFFGYTNCPDICPATMSQLQAALVQLDRDDADRVEVAFITVDPTRDTPERLAGFVATVDKGRALRTEDQEALWAVADRFGASFEVAENPDGTVDVGHTTSVFAVDASGAVRLVWVFGTAVDDMAADLDALLGQP